MPYGDACRWRLGISIVVMAVALAIGSARAQRPVQWTGPGGNGHYYEYYKFPRVDWYEADARARGMSYLGMSGHLVTIASAAEQRFVEVKVQPLVWPTWYGAYQDMNAPDYAEPGGGWRWVTGEPWLFTAWAPLEPNNYNNGPGFDQEDGLVYSSYYVGNNWNDAPRRWKYEMGAFVVEYEPIPESGTLPLLLAAGPVALALIRRRRR